MYLESLRQMGPQARLQKAFELSEQSKRLFRLGLRQRFPDLAEEEFHRLYLERMVLYHNSKYEASFARVRVL